MPDLRRPARDHPDFEHYLRLVHPEDREHVAATIAEAAESQVDEYEVDHRVLHGVTPIRPLDPASPAIRDVLVATYRREDAAT